MKKKKTKWERNLEQVKRAQQRAINEIERLKKLGYEVSETTERHVREALKSRYTKEQANKYSRITGNVQRIRSFVKPRTIKIDQPYTKPKEIKARGLKSIDMEIVKNVFADIKTTITKYPTRDFAHQLYIYFRDIYKKTGIDLLKGHTARAMDKAIKAITPKDLYQGLKKFEEKTGETIVNFAELMYQYAITPQARKSKRAEELEDAKRSFKQRNISPTTNQQFDDAVIDKLYKFFDSAIWSTYRNEKQSYYTNDDVTKVADLIQNENLTYADINNLLDELMSAGSVDKALENWKRRK